MTFKKLLLPFFVLSLFMSGCSDDKDRSLNEGNVKVLDADKRFKVSTTLGNFVATAIQKTHDLDFVFFPTEFIPPDAKARVELGMNSERIERVVSLFPAGPTDSFIVGTMKGKDIEEFIVNRSREKYSAELEVAGLWYFVSFDGGIDASKEFLIDGRFELDSNRYYSIAISDEYYFGPAFPGYKFRNGFNFTFRRTRFEISTRDSIRAYLKNATEFPYWGTERAKVDLVKGKNKGFKKISEIQGDTHSSPLINSTVTTRGVITAYGTQDWYPGGTEFFIESTVPDGDPKTSEALHVRLLGLDTFGLDLNLGDYVEVTGTVFEDVRGNGMGDTTLRFITNITLLDQNAEDKLPEAASLSRKDRSIPTKRISTYGGRLMEKEFLNLSDGVDFWESLEGMRVKFVDPVVLGFRGGREDYYQDSAASYLNLYVTPQEFLDRELETHHGGLLVEFNSQDFNPEIFSMITNHLTYTKNLDEDKFYSVGDVFKGEIEGVLIYNQNLFGDGEYAVVLPRPQENLIKSKAKRGSRVPLKRRPVSQMVSDLANEVTIATYNLENLSAFQFNRRNEDRVAFMADSIVTNLKCPDVLNLVEIQDDNGIDFRRTQSAQITLRKLRSLVQSSCLNRRYEFVEVAPFLHGEGGQPGGNIRVSIMYNSLKLSIDERSDGAYGAPAIVMDKGLLSNNPGRVYPLNKAFKGSRRSLAVEFTLNAKPSEKIYLIGNHLNSKLGDADFWGNQQIARAGSDEKRTPKTALINKFVHWIEGENPNANIVVLGDFNALAQEDSMRVLTNNGETLKNMIFTLPKNKRYTTNHNGSSQPLDYVFVNRKAEEKQALAEVLHINSDYMARLSDHDPVIVRLRF